MLFVITTPVAAAAPIPSSLISCFRRLLQEQWKYCMAKEIKYHLFFQVLIQVKTKRIITTHLFFYIFIFRKGEGKN